VEAWTLKDFNAHTLAFGPESNEFKEKNWSQNRVALVNYDRDSHPHKLHIVIDGRLRSNVCDSRPFSLFFAISAGASEDKADKRVNMSVGYATVKSEVTVQLPFPKSKAKTHSQDLAQIPVMYNKQAIQKHVRLVCNTDGTLSNLTAQINKRKAETLISEATDKAKKKKKAAGGCE